MAEHTGAEAGAEAVPGERENGDGDGGAGAAVVSLGDGRENDGGAGRRPEDETGRGVVVAFGQTMKTLRVREGLEREEFGRRLGYSASTIASFEQGRRIPTSRIAGQKQNVEIQVMPTECEENAGVNGPFTVVTRKDGKKFVYTETHTTSSLETDPEQTALAAARHGIIRSQALSPQESTKFIEGLPGTL
ncbi:Scr1 family TA system antitoxin-like transcriptional regulator [Streptomyces sp. JHA26]|uniref:Scr1 family TA system antitoxin-like transcriptional regulator n=1 Tax=Streptomyces sp. JHA26 TaxID=1917143 RepID=UPI00098A6FBC|nr:Scr1 family TA system antitoxin-like transcriptional regulator [Streptomyces sp. JHA26]